MTVSRLPLLLLAAIGLVAAGCGSSPALIQQSENPDYTSAYSPDDRVVGPYDLDAIAEAPQRKVVMMHFDRPVDDVFEFLLTAVDDYDESIVEVTFDHSQSETPGQFGVGTRRTCVFDNGKILVEPLLVYEEDRFYAYTVDAEASTFSIPLRDIVMFYSFEERGPQSTLVTVRAHYTPKIWIASPIISSVFKRTVDKTFASATAAFDGRLIDPDA